MAGNQDDLARALSPLNEGAALAGAGCGGRRSSPEALPGRPPEVFCPVGTVLMWWGQVADIPRGFELCDGGFVATPGAVLTGIKPDLRDRFPKGAVPSALQVTDLVLGGQNNLPSHQHGVPGLVLGDGSHVHEGGVHQHAGGDHIHADGVHQHSGGAHTHTPNLSRSDTGGSGPDVAGFAVGRRAAGDNRPAITLGAHTHGGGAHEHGGGGHVHGGGEHRHEGGAHTHPLAGFVGAFGGINGDGQDVSGANRPAFQELFFIIRVR